MDQVVDPTNLSVHAVQACDLVGLVTLHEVVPVSPVKLFIAFLPVDKGPSKILTSHFDLCVQLVAWCAATGSAFIEGSVRRVFALSHRGTALSCASCLCRQCRTDQKWWRLSSTQLPRAQEMMASSLSCHETGRDDKHLRVEFSIFSCEWVIFRCPKSIGWLHSECAQVLEFVHSLDPMFLLLHLIWLPQRFWSTNGIVAGRWARPTLRSVPIVLGAIAVGSTIIGTIFEGVIVVFFLDVGSGLVRSIGSLRFGSVRLP